MREHDFEARRPLDDSRRGREPSRPGFGRGATSHDLGEIGPVPSRGQRRRPTEVSAEQRGGRIYPYGVNRARLEQLVRGLPALVTYDVDEADVVLTMKNYYRRKPQALRDAESAGKPIYVLRSGSAGQLDEAVSRIVHRDRTTPASAAAQALQETEDAIAQVLDNDQPVELTPQGAYVRRLQHQLAEQYNLGSRSAAGSPTDACRSSSEWIE